ncbi:RNA 2'-phosphotransferase [Paenibacillus alvei]|uniref:RNA 2'-phosphotransferase n=1 Tax=Paenibacillus alvei TaxID=44250 RepID=UPI00227E2B66|nr:RNA 2'-phosphotransferase [Paenibacillus alvei]MCY9757677.1 RNA 2'-phosphotransferase [Paenibacillus alvei]
MNKRTEIRMSRFISKILRHESKQFGLEQDDNNFVQLSSFINVVLSEFEGSVSLADVVYVLESSKKDGHNRFQIVGDRVRATYNHTWKTKGDV